MASIPQQHMATLLTPGDRLCASAADHRRIPCPAVRAEAQAEYAPGPGTYERGADICSSLLGARVVLPPQPNTADKRPVVSVVSRGAQQAVPKAGDVVTAKVTKLNPRFASLDILCVGDRPLDATFSGIIRQQDVRATEVDKVELIVCFRPGDLVRASVLSLGDSRSYLLTTARNELGVVYAKSATSGQPMVPISWEEMQCPDTKGVEKRKVAKTLP